MVAVAFEAVEDEVESVFELVAVVGDHRDREARGPKDSDHSVVVVRVHAAGWDRGVWHIMAGLPYPIRLAGYGFRAPKTPVRGREVAGRVEAVGRNVTTLRTGDDVYGVAKGTFAEYALQAVHDRGQVRSGQKVMVIGAGSASSA